LPEKPAVPIASESLPTGSALGRGWTLLLLLPFTLVVGLAILAPLAQLLIQSLDKGLEGYTYLFRSSLRLHIIGRTLRDCAYCTVLCVILGFMLAWSLHRTQRRTLRLLLSAAVFLPLWMNVTMKNYACMIILGRGGVLQSVLAAFGIAAHSLLFTSTAVIIGLVYTLFPFATLPLLVALRAIPNHVLQAAESMGASRTGVLATIVLPQIAAPACATALLVYILAMGFYVTPLILGGAHSTFVASLIQDDMFRRFDRVAAATMSIVLILLSLTFMTAGTFLMGRSRLSSAVGH
jgi:ABC-type spermidine/putrescine transport system permease subunit I